METVKCDNSEVKCTEFTKNIISKTKQVWNLQRISWVKLSILRLTHCCPTRVLDKVRISALFDTRFSFVDTSFIMFKQESFYRLTW